MKNYTKLSVVKEMIEHSRTLKGKEIKSINLIDRCYNELLNEYTQSLVVVATINSIIYVYRACLYEDTLQIAYTPFKFDFETNVLWN